MIQGNEEAFYYLNQKVDPPSGGIGRGGGIGVRRKSSAARHRISLSSQHDPSGGNAGRSGERKKGRNDVNGRGKKNRKGTLGKREDWRREMRPAGEETKEEGEFVITGACVSGKRWRKTGYGQVDAARIKARTGLDYLPTRREIPPDPHQEATWGAADLVKSNIDRCHVKRGGG